MISARNSTGVESTTILNLGLRELATLSVDQVARIDFYSDRLKEQLM